MTVINAKILTLGEVHRLLMPLLNLMEPESSVVLLQVLKAICKL
ncbi:hypothetical protein [Microcoleus sp. bin38.metabat.b11b12b14.051]|nr:hypothetical protein [Microcoleus sp. bin38.metabat.b11b12b14.051]